MKKRVLSLLLVCSMILSMFAGLSVTAFAADAEDDFEIDAEGVITDYTGDGGNVVIPDTIDGTTVTAIGDQAFMYYNYNISITSITIPATVDSIGMLAFCLQENLTDVTFLGTCTEIDSSAFDKEFSGTIHCQKSDEAHYTAIFNENCPDATVEAVCTHVWGLPTVTKEATCTEAGEKERTCSLCGNVDKEAIPATGHTYVDGVCTACGAKEPCTEHTWDEGKITTAPTCTAKGEKTYTCTVCGAEKTEPVDTVDHTYEDGVCTVCGAKQSALVVLDGKGTQSSPYQLSDADDLATLSTAVKNGETCADTYFRVMCDIDAGNLSPIGTSSNPFSGTFDGRNAEDDNAYCITLNMTGSGTNRGLFGYIKNATISNLIVKGTVSGGTYVGGVVGQAIGSTLENLGNEATVTSTYGYAGGVVGAIKNDTSAGGPACTVTGCYNRGDVTCTYSSTNYAGGVIGYAHSSSPKIYITDCYNTGSVTFTTASYNGKVGGILGSDASSSKAVLTNCYNAGSVTGGARSAVGAICGPCSGTPTLTNCYFLSGKYAYVYSGTTTELDASGVANAGSDNAVKLETEAEMKAAAEKLGSSYKADSGINSGYPVLSWEKTCEHPAGSIENVAEVPAACTVNGYTAGKLCNACGVYIEGHEVIAPLGHTHDTGAAGTVTAPTCTEQGYTTYTCTRCGVSYQADFTDALGHDFDENGECTRTGCDAVDSFYTFFSGVKQYLQPKKTEGSVWANVDNKLEAKGKTTGDSFTLTAKESGELTLSVATYYTTLTVKQNDTEVKKLTGSYDKTAKDIVLHVTAGDVLTVQYSCSNSSTYYYCQLTAVSFKADCKHLNKDRQSKAPTCDECGYELGDHCTDCGEYFGKLIPPTGHTFIDGACSTCGSKDTFYTFFSSYTDDLVPVNDKTNGWTYYTSSKYIRSKSGAMNSGFTVYMKKAGTLELSGESYYNYGKVNISVNGGTATAYPTSSYPYTFTYSQKLAAGDVVRFDYELSDTYSYSSSSAYVKFTAISFAADEPVVENHTITATAGDNGTITPSGAVKVEDGKSQTFTVTANTGYMLDTLTVDGEAASLTNGTYTFNNVTADHTISATFKEAPVVDLFQKFFETRTGLTAENSTDKPWSTNDRGTRLIASGAEQKVFTLTAATDGYLTVAVECQGTLTSLTLTSGGKTLEEISPVIALYTETKVVPVKANEPITFTYACTAVYGADDCSIAITNLTLAADCPHTSKTMLEYTPATCETNGCKLHYICNSCGKVLDKDGNETTKDAVTIPAAHTYDEENALFSDGTAKILTCTVCGKTTVVANSAEGATTHTVTVTGENAKWTAEGKINAASYTVGDGNSFYFLASADVGYTLSVTGAEAVASYKGEAAGYSALYKLANVTADASITLTTTAAPKSDYNFDVRTVNGEQVAYILGYTGNGGAITLPTEYNDGTTTYPVVGVAEGAFCGNGNYLDKQGSSPLESLETITSITVPKGIKYIEALAFDYVGRYQTSTWLLESVIFEDPDTVFVPYILNDGTERNVQLGGNPNLKTVQLPANLTKIPSSLFYGDTSLNNLVLPVGVTAIGARAFDGCTGLTNLTILSATPPTVETYSYLLSKQYPFRGCTVTITVPKGSLAAYQTAWKDMLEADTDLAGTIILREQDGEIALSQFTVDDIDYLVVDREKMTVEVKHVNKNSGSKDAPSGKLVIPSTVTAVQTIDGQPQSFVFTVVGIGKQAMDFMGYEPRDYVSTSYWFAEVEFPNTLTYIGDWGCAGLEGVKVLDLSNTKVASIGDSAFNNCGNVETIKLPDTLQNLGKPVEIERPTDDAMDGNETDLGTADPGDESNVKADGPEAAPTQGTENVFRGCQKLKEFVVNDTNPYFSVKDGVLFNKNGTKLIRYPVGKSDASYAIPEGTQIIAEAAFMQIAGNQANGALKSVTFPSSLKKIEDGAFRQSSLTSVELPAGVEFGSYIFDCSKNLQTVTTADGVTEIPAKAFWGCEGLTSVTLAASVKSIGESAFERAGFKTIDLTNVTKIGKYAFYFSKLETVTVPAAAQCDTGAFMNCPKLKTATLEGTTIYPYMFWYCTDLETLNASNVTTIEDCALGYCVKLTSLPLDHVTTIGNGAFRNCHGLQIVTIPGSVQSFGKYVFADCGELTSVTFAGNANVTSLPEGTFYECVNLQEVHLGDYISQTEGLSLYMAGWYNGLKVNVYCNQPKEYFFRNQFDTCFIDLGNQQLDSENKDKDDITYIWTNTTYNDSDEPVYHFRAAVGGGCGGGCGGGTSADADGRAEYTMSPSVNAIFHYAVQDGGATLAELAPARASTLYSALPTVLTVYMQDRQTGEKTTLAAYTLSDLEAMATKSTAGYQYVGMKGWAVMAATEYVTIDRLLAGEALGTGDTLVVTADDASYSVTFDDLEANTYFFPNSKSNTNKSQEGKQVVPAMVALTWNTGKIETEPDSAALAQVAATAYKSTNLRFAHGLSWSSYEQLEDCDSMASDDVCSAMRMLQRVQSITLVRDSIKPTEAVVTVEATISGKNASVDASKLYDALDILADNGTLIVDAKKSSASGVSLTLPGADVRTLANKNAQLVIETALGSVTLDAASLAGLASAAGSGNVVLTLDKLLRSSLSAALQNELDEHAAIYQLTATCGGKAVTTLNGTAQLKLPYTLQTDELAANVRTSILSGDTCTALTASYADGYATFTTTILSRFAVDVPGKRSSVTISLTPTVSGGKASASVDADEAKKALEDLKDGGELILDATTSKAISASEVTLPKSILESLVKQKQSLRVRMNGAELALDASALSSAAAKLTGTSFKICSEQLANVDLPKAARATFENADLWRVWLTDGTRELTELTSGTASVTLTYTPEKTQNAADFRAYAVSDDGTYNALTATNDKTAYTLTFSGRRLGVFALTDRLNGVMPFTDVYTSDWYYDDVRYVYENGLMNGVTTTLFAPKTNITRGMLVTILWRVEGEPTAPANSFTDVASGSYYEKAIAWAEYKGVVTGFGGGLFKPNAPITREQFVTILYRYASLKGMQTAASGSLASFSDAASVSAYAVDAVRWAVGAGLMNGKNGRIDPAGFTTRAESAALLHRYLA